MCSMPWLVDAFSCLMVALSAAGSCCSLLCLFDCSLRCRLELYKRG